MFRTATSKTNVFRRDLSAILRQTAVISSHGQLLLAADSRFGIRYYCKEREPRKYPRNPSPLHRRIELPNPAFTERKPKPLESMSYFDEDGQEDTEPGEPDILYSSIEIETRGHDTAVLKSYETFALSAAKYLDITVSKVYVPREPYIWWMRTLLRSVHIFKKRRYQYETRTYYRRFTIARVTGSTADTFLEYIQRNLPEGVGMRVMRRVFVERPDFLKQPPKGVLALEAEKMMADNDKRTVKKAKEGTLVI